MLINFFSKGFNILLSCILNSPSTEDFINCKPIRHRKTKFRGLIRDSIPKILQSFLGDDGMSEVEIINLYGNHIHNLENCLFLQARSKKEYTTHDTLKDRIFDLLTKIDHFLYPNEAVEI